MSRALLATVTALTVAILPRATPAQDLAIRASAIVWIPAGTARVGANDSDIEEAVRLCRSALPLVFLPGSSSACDIRRFIVEMPARRAFSAAFGIDRTEVTQAAWARCVGAGRCPPSRLAGHDAELLGPTKPVAAVTWDEADRYCRFVGGRLPTEVEWERAARGNSLRRFPWGRQYDRRLANHGRAPQGPDASDGHRLAAPVGSYPDGASLYGVLDLAGNVWEWTSDPPRPDEYPTGFDRDQVRVFRGGSWSQPPVSLRVTHRMWLGRVEHRGDLGFRCAHDPRR